MAYSLTPLRAIPVDDYHKQPHQIPRTFFPDHSIVPVRKILQKKLSVRVDYVQPETNQEQYFFPFFVVLFKMRVWIAFDDVNFPFLCTKYSEKSVSRTHASCYKDVHLIGKNTRKKTRSSCK